MFGAPGRRSPGGDPGAPIHVSSEPSPVLFSIGVILPRLHAIPGRARQLVRRGPTQPGSPPRTAPSPGGREVGTGPRRGPSRTRGSFETAGLPRSIVRSSFFYIIVPARASAPTICDRAGVFG